MNNNNYKGNKKEELELFYFKGFTLPTKQNMLFGILCEFRRNTTNLLRRKNGNIPDVQLKLYTHTHTQIKE